MPCSRTQSICRRAQTNNRRGAILDHLRLRFLRDVRRLLARLGVAESDRFEWCPVDLEGEDIEPVIVPKDIVILLGLDASV